MKRRLFRNKKGLSTVISTILMIMVVMIGMSLLFAYVVYYSDNYKNGIGGSVMESLTVEDVWVKPGNIVEVSVFNTATKANLGTSVGLEVAAIYVDGAALDNNNSTSTNYHTINFRDVPVKAGYHITFSGKSSQSIMGGTHDIAIATIRGSNFKAQFTVP